MRILVSNNNFEFELLTTWYFCCCSFWYFLKGERAGERADVLNSLKQLSCTNTHTHTFTRLLTHALSCRCVRLQPCVCVNDMRHCCCSLKYLFTAIYCVAFFICTYVYKTYKYIYIFFKSNYSRRQLNMSTFTIFRPEPDKHTHTRTYIGGIAETSLGLVVDKGNLSTVTAISTQRP